MHKRRQNTGRYIANVRVSCVYFGSLSLVQINSDDVIALGRILHGEREADVTEPDNAYPGSFCPDFFGKRLACGRGRNSGR